MNSGLDQQIADVKARTDIPDSAKQDILLRLERSKRTDVQRPHPPAPRS